MKSTFISSMAISLLFMGCSSSPTIINYDSSQVTANDQLPLPSDAPAQVNAADINVPRLMVDIAAETGEASAPLRVEKVTDSFGQTSLKINRNTASSWELVDQALIELDIETSDRNRSEYRFELSENAEKQSFFKRLFAEKTHPLLLVLIPSGQNTIINLESDNDELPDRKKAEELLSKLLTHWSE